MHLVPARMPNTVYYFPVLDDGSEGEPLVVKLGAGGEADLSALPEDVRKHLAYGVPDRLHQGEILPAEGAAFLEALLRETDGYMRFRTTPERRTV